MSDIEFVDGLIVKPPHEKAPDFVKAGISIKRKDLGNWLRGKTDDWINIDVKESKDGKWYCSVSTWKPKAKDEKTGSKPGIVDDDIPFAQFEKGSVV